MIVVNFYGGPGTGKSTIAAGVFSRLKFLNLKCELVTEFAKDLTYEGRNVALANQVYVFAKQYHRLSRLENHTLDFVLVDSPLKVSNAYSTCEELKALVNKVSNSYDNINIFLKRVKPYQKYGRNQTEYEAQELDQIYKSLVDNCIEFDGSEQEIDNIVNHLVNYFTLQLKGRCGV